MENKRRLKDEYKLNLLAQIEEVKLAIEKKRESTSRHVRMLWRMLTVLSTCFGAAGARAAAVEE